MPARVTGEKREIADRPGVLSSDSLGRLRKAMEDERKLEEEEAKKPVKPKPTCDVPAGYEDLKWSKTEGYWVCFSKPKDVRGSMVWDKKGMIWDEEKEGEDKWCTWEDWEERHQYKLPRGGRTPKQTKTWAEKTIGVVGTFFRWGHT